MICRRMSYPDDKRVIVFTLLGRQVLKAMAEIEADLEGALQAHRVAYQECLAATVDMEDVIYLPLESRVQTGIFLLMVLYDPGFQGVIIDGYKILGVEDRQIELTIEGNTSRYTYQAFEAQVS